ncbi:hypothetical protein HBH91_096230 [Parastagonospora nodorum]|nr:hypothetical protein HBH91_096230 [Parastagonospora nodorum]KAH4779402.1 hypothetical protein HBH63_129180 [Parastagonospora nodorum]
MLLVQVCHRCTNSTQTTQRRNLMYTFCIVSSHSKHKTTNRAEPQTNWPEQKLSLQPAATNAGLRMRRPVPLQTIIGLHRAPTVF